MNEEFGAASPQDALWFGNEAKTCLKRIEALNACILTRSRRATSDNELELLRVRIKETAAVYRVVQEIDKHGLMSMEWPQLMTNK